MIIAYTITAVDAVITFTTSNNIDSSIIDIDFLLSPKKFPRSLLVPVPSLSERYNRFWVEPGRKEKKQLDIKVSTKREM